MRLRTRLQMLERSRLFAGCPACRQRHIIVMRTGTQQADGSVVWDRDAPKPCPRCGKIPDQIIEVHLPFLGERSDGCDYRMPS